MYKKKKVKNKISKFQNGNLFGWRRKSGKNHYLFLKFQNIEEVLYFIELY